VVHRVAIAHRRRTALNVAVNAGATQLVVLGAGLDTLAYRTQLAGRLRIFEIDHPATQAQKREMLAAAAIAVPERLSFVPVDFEAREKLSERLEAAGFKPAERSFFSWLGVVPYLTEAAIFSTLGYMAQLPGGAEVVFDYVNPATSVSAAAGRTAHQALAARVAAIGERFSELSRHPLRYAQKMSAAGFRHVDDIGPAELGGALLSGNRAVGTDAGRACHARPPRSERRRAQSELSQAKELGPLPSASVNSR